VVKSAVSHHSLQILQLNSDDRGILGTELLLLLHALRLSLGSISRMLVDDHFTFGGVFGRRGRLHWTYFQSWKVNMLISNHEGHNR
jgi:hypothetical protein